MGATRRKKLDAYSRRIRKERTVLEDAIEERMRWDMPILSANHKCLVTLDLPVLNCTPTKACAEVCYACQGRQMYRRAIVKSLAINRMITDDPKRAARRMVDEAAGRAIRLAGSGDILPQHKPMLDYIESLGGSWWGFTRRIDTHKTLPRLMFSIDATSRASALEYARADVSPRRRAYLRRPADSEPPLEVAVLFPVHGSTTNCVDFVPIHERDCPAVRGTVMGCWQCERCY